MITLTVIVQGIDLLMRTWKVYRGHRQDMQIPCKVLCIDGRQLNHRGLFLPAASESCLQLSVNQQSAQAGRAEI